jgi:cob(I)alamin adenosyltransferase
MPKIYTGTGDGGETGLFGGGRVPKDHARVEACGSLDEANSALGLLASHLDPDLAGVISHMQHTLFDIGADLATPEPGPRHPPSIAPGAVEALERLIDHWEAELEPLGAFILPGGSHAAALCHLARSLARRAERRTVTLARAAPVHPEILRYLNRLSDCLFVLARLLNRRAGIADVRWEGGQK